MKHLDLKGNRKTIAVFSNYQSGYYTFNLETGEVVVFEEINRKILEQFDLKGTQCIGKKFRIEFDEIVDDENLVIYRLEYIKEL